MQDAQVELDLHWATQGIGKINHLLRANGDELLQYADALREHDDVQTKALTRLLPGLDDSGIGQAFNTMSLGGIGLAKAQEIAAAAHLASLTASKPMLQSLAEQAEKVGFLSKEVLMSTFERKRSSLVNYLERQVGEEFAPLIRQLVTAADEHACKAWQHVCDGTLRPNQPAPQVKGRADSGHLRADPTKVALRTCRENLAC